MLKAMGFEAKVYYLERLKLYETEKPYMVAFELPVNTGSTTNHSYAPFQVHMTDAQSIKDSFSLDVHGFQFEQWPTDLKPEDFDDDDTGLLTYGF
ncbi:uncharacterized protein E0L32_011594 [Thyridium curvatum]|uniref:Uncharacterized protein n=1 Tax=Thyridium curvatum TaxID=1093900 RepID=A0A507BMP1_9PEZI|nr:uncharacterized protein E0L32_011594 [Thyridium curvatum]TPX18481.1 hypothetical protein E0L32_011594 [Thyridium curvatum]